jgi:replication factor A2
VKVWGRIKDFNDRRHIQCHVIRPITDFNEISAHLLEATAVHLYFSRGPLDSGAVVKTEDGMFVDNFQGGTTNGNGAAPSVGGRLPANTSQVARQVYKLLQDSPQNNEGLHVANIAQQLKIQQNDVFKAGDELLQGGLIYTTIDDETWAVLEY